MKTFIALLAVATCCLAAEVPYTPAGSNPQGALLVLPLQQAKGDNSTSTTPRSLANGTETLEDINVKLSETLKKEEGSQQGVFHVYLQDGRLQRVQYTTAPVAPVQQTQQQQTASNNYNQQQTPEILSPEFAGKRGVYFVQVPQERIQALQANAQQTSQQSTQKFQPSGPAQFKQESTPVNVRYLPLGGTPDEAKISQYRQEEAIVRYLAVPLGEEIGQYSQQYGQQKEQQAVVQYSEVQPISGPVYSYSPQAITRILRYAPVY